MVLTKEKEYLYNPESNWSKSRENVFVLIPLNVTNQEEDEEEMTLVHVFKTNTTSSSIPSYINPIYGPIHTTKSTIYKVKGDVMQ